MNLKVTYHTYLLVNYQMRHQMQSRQTYLHAELVYDLSIGTLLRVMTNEPFGPNCRSIFIEPSGKIKCRSITVDPFAQLQCHN